MEHPSNREIASVLEQLAEHSWYVGARYPARAYRSAAVSIARLPMSVGAMAMAGRATELRGIGSSIQSRIAEYCETGTVRELERLREEAPPARLFLGRVPGIGAKTIDTIWNELRPRTLEELEEMVDDGRLESVKGIGPVTLDAVRSTFHQLAEGPEQLAEPMIRSHALRALRDLERVITSSVDGVLRVHEGGELARGCELVEVIDVVVVTEDAQRATSQLRELLDARGWHATAEHAPFEDECLTFALDALSGAGIRIHVTDEAHEDLSYLYAVGPAEHARAVLDWARHEPPGPVGAIEATARDASIYARARMAWVAPELRDRPELLGTARAAHASAEELPRLVRVEDLRGELHCHSTWSDGRKSTEEMARAAIERGYEFMAITDHSWSLRIVNGLSPGDLAAQWRELEYVRAALPPDFHLLHGTEMDILPDGSLDYDDDTLSRLDWVVASIHVKQRQSAEEITARMERALRNPYVDCIGHPTSRLLLRRPKTALDTDRLIELAAETGTFLEINSSPDRLDLDAETARRAADAGVLLAINSDAHGAATLDIVEYGASIARRAGLRPEQILNTRSWDEIRPLQKRWRA